MAANFSLSGSSGSRGLETFEGMTEANRLMDLTEHRVKETLLNGAGPGKPRKETGAHHTTKGRTLLPHG